MEENHNYIDEAMVPFHEHVCAMLEIEGVIESGEAGFKMKIDAVGIESPVQLDINVDENGKVIIGSSPPLYYLSTGIMPVFHTMRFNAVIVETETKITDYES
jgi:hypothetical protein